MNDLIYPCLILVLFGFCLRVSLRLLYGIRGPQVGDPVYLMLNTASWLIILLPLTVFLTTEIFIFSWVLIPVLAYAILEWILARRAMQKHFVWELLQGKLGLFQHTPATLHMHKSRFTGIVGRSFRKLVRSLEEGSDVLTAISANPSAVPPEAQAFGSVNRLSNVTLGADDSIPEQELRIADSQLVIVGQQFTQHIVYFLYLLMVLTTISSFLLIKVVPGFQKIFEDFGLFLPEMTQFLIALANGFSQSMIPAILSFLIFTLTLAALIGYFFYLVDIPILNPVTDRLFFSRHRALILQLFAFAAERGDTFYELTKQLTEGKPRYPSGYVRRRLRKVLRHMSSGKDWKDALRKASIVKKLDFPMLESAQQAGNLPWVLRLLADQKLRRMTYRWAAVERIAFPISILSIGLFVMFFCVALFIPLVNLINNFTG